MGVGGLRVSFFVGERSASSALLGCLLRPRIAVASPNHVVSKFSEGAGLRWYIMMRYRMPATPKGR